MANSVSESVSDSLSSSSDSQLIPSFTKLRSSLTWRAFALLPSDPLYESERGGWNHDFTAKPSLIICPTSVTDVITAVNYVRENQLEFTVTSGKHTHFSCRDNTVMISLNHMRSVSINPDNKIAYVEPGARTGDLDATGSAYHLHTVLGDCSDVGIAGLILGGGAGYLSRQYGMCVDNVIEIELVNWKGEIVRANENTNKELFWGLKGAGFNFGIITKFTLKLYEIGHINKELTESDQAVIEREQLPNQSDLAFKIVGGMYIWPFDYASKIYSTLNEWNRAGYERTVHFITAIANAPTGQAVVIMKLAYVGRDIYEGFRVLRAKLDQLPTPIPVASIPIAPMTYVSLQRSMDEIACAGPAYERSVLVKELNSSCVETLVNAWGTLPKGAERSGIISLSIGGAIGDGDIDRSSVAREVRESKFWVLIFVRFNSSMKEEAIEWAKNLKNSLTSFITIPYTNSVSNDDKAEDLYTSHYSRLQAIKKQWDPTNFFHYNHNIKPAEE